MGLSIILVQCKTVYFHHRVVKCHPPSFLCVCADKDRDKAKERYIKASVKLHELHNEYVLSVRAAQVYHQHHYSQIQPTLLSALQTLQQEMVFIL